MVSSLTNATRFSEQEFSCTDFGDKRLTRRAVSMAAALARNPVGTLPNAMQSLKDIKGAYKFLDNPSVNYEKITAPHRQCTREETELPGEYLLPEDTTELDFTTHWAAKGLGRIGNDGGRGMMLHSTLALRVLRWSDNRPDLDIVGLWAQRCWTRTDPPRRGRETHAEHWQRPRESEKWAHALAATDGPPPGAKWTLVADREADVYETFTRCLDRGVDFILRATQARALDKSDQSIFDEVAAAPVLGRYELFLRARPGQPSRTANIEVRAVSVMIRGPWRPGGQQAPLRLNVVQASEARPSPAANPLHWVLLTTWACETFDDARKVTAAYAARWLVEEYHKALKTGTQVEKSQLATAKRLQALLGIMSIVAVRLLRMKFLVEMDPDQLVEWDAETSAIRAVLEARFAKPKEGWTNRTVLISIAKLGGFLGRKSDGNPGWITVWRGVKELMLQAEGYSIAGASPR